MNDGTDAGEGTHMDGPAGLTWPGCGQGRAYVSRGTG